MLNALKLSDLLAKNVDPRLYPRMFVMSPNGTLLAYSTPVDIKDLRDQAALISMAWKEHEASFQSKQPRSRSSEAGQSEDSVSVSGLETLTIEFQHNNIIVRALQPKLLLVLVGGVPPSRKVTFKITPEGYGDRRYPSSHVPETELVGTQQEEGIFSVASSTPGDEAVGSGKKRAASIASNMSQRDKDIKLGALHIQRKKIDSMTDFIRKDFDSKGFIMPDDSSFP